MSTADNDNNNKDDICANCGKGEEGSATLKACTACKLVKYCNRECQIAHRPLHKKDCKKRAAELHDEKLFKQPPPEYGDCPICFLRLPALGTGRRYMTCCGKMICSGCNFAPVYDNEGNVVDEKTCPFCRTPESKSNEESIRRVTKRMDAGDDMAIHNQGCYYREGTGFPQDDTKAFEFYQRAGRLGNAASNFNIAQMYMNGIGVEVDKKKAGHHYELAAIEGHVEARHNLGCFEKNAERALKHYMIAVRGGAKNSLDYIQYLYSNGHASKQDYSTALRSYQVYLAEIKSDQRDKAAAADEVFKYIE